MHSQVAIGVLICCGPQTTCLRISAAARLILDMIVEDYHRARDRLMRLLRRHVPQFRWQYGLSPQHLYQLVVERMHDVLHEGAHPFRSSCAHGSYGVSVVTCLCLLLTALPHSITSSCSLPCSFVTNFSALILQLKLCLLLRSWPALP